MSTHPLAGVARPFLSAGLTLALALMLSGGCVPKPKQDYSADQVKGIESIEELMRVQAQTADPQFAKIGQASYTDKDYAGFNDAAQRLQATAETLRTRFAANRPPSFGTYAARLGEQAGELSAAVSAKDAAKISSTLTGIRDTCRTCHKEHR